MDNYYNLFKSDNKPSKHRSSKKTHYSSRRSSGNSLGVLSKIFKVFCILLGIFILAFLVLMLFSSKLTYQSANEKNISEYLKNITNNERVAGTQNEINTAKYINDLMCEFGFESSLDGFEINPYDGLTYARNVVAVKKASLDMDNGDILVLTTHYDSQEGTVGANDNAAGVACLLELANTIKGEKTDTTIVFVFTSDTYEDNRGVRYLISNLSNLKLPLEKIIGVIDINKIGINTTSGLKVITSERWL